MAAYRKTFNGEDYVTHGITEVPKKEAKQFQKRAKGWGYKTRVVFTRTDNTSGFTVYVRKKESKN